MLTTDQIVEIMKEIADHDNWKREKAKADEESSSVWGFLCAVVGNGPSVRAEPIVQNITPWYEMEASELVEYSSCSKLNK